MFSARELASYLIAVLMFHRPSVAAGLELLGWEDLEREGLGGIHKHLGGHACSKRTDEAQF